jgi:asparagine synthase (glutamine-hydrolysing)
MKTVCFYWKGHFLSHERLSIVDLSTGKQPIQGTTTALYS